MPAHPGETLPLGTPVRTIPRHDPVLDEILTEVKAIRDSQMDILALVRGESAPPAETGEVEEDVFRVAPVRSRRRKSVLLIDDDLTARQAAVAAMEQAEVPVRATGDGNGGIAAIASEKPDVIVIDLALGGSVSAKDVINMIKATMDWVDIPIVLYTGVAVDGQKEARQVHGADELVPKGAGPDALVSKVIALFRKG
jgi:CheY-like chemotaxis protein